MDVVSVNLIRNKKEDYFFKFAQHSYLHIMNQKFMILQGGNLCNHRQNHNHFTIQHRLLAPDQR